nr:ASN_HP1_G0005050.mRNA.1.CDS.1 [Saccharomyces cerevisiae]
MGQNDTSGECGAGSLLYWCGNGNPPKMLRNAVFFPHFVDGVFGLGKTFKPVEEDCGLWDMELMSSMEFFSNVSFILKNSEHVQVKFHAIEVLVEKTWACIPRVRTI